MTQKKDTVNSHRITTDDLAFSAYLKMKGYHLIKSDRKKSKIIFTFDANENVDRLKVEFINSEFVRFYNELRNLKKMVSTY